MDATEALLRALDEVGPRLRAVAEAAADPSAEPPAEVDERATEQLLRAFEALLREALEGGSEQRELVIPTAVPALIASGQSSMELLEAHVSFFLVVSAQLLAVVDDAVRDDAAGWLAQYAGAYVREVTEVGLAAERDATGGAA